VKKIKQTSEKEVEEFLKTQVTRTYGICKGR
jgi:hypothetical protein